MIKSFSNFNRRGKYNAKRSKCWAGHFHASRLEARVCDRLLSKVQGGEIKSYESQVKFPLTQAGQHITNHFVDFLLTHLDGRKEVWEAKGHPTQIWVLKMKMFIANYPDIKYTVVKK